MKRFIIIIVLIAIGIGLYFYFERTPQVQYEKPNVPRPVGANSTASIVVKEFSDFQCPACGAAHPMVKNILAEFNNDIRFELYHFPLISIHPYAFDAALSAECANDQGKFWDMANTLFENQTSLLPTDLKVYAENIGLDQVKFNACLDSRAHRDRVNDDIKQGNALGVDSTPTFFLNGQKVADWSALPGLIQMEINRKKAEAEQKK
ncbi:MAG TPA: DsbA family protein [Patescibacteria group bacterium]|nr:DsbA family protein [Patescibacteria group bacterium]